MKHFLTIFWWLAAIPVIAIVIVSLGYPFNEAVSIAVMFLPGMLCARYFLPQLSFEDRRKGTLDALWLTLAILCLEYFCIMLVNIYINEICATRISPLLMNPLFLLVVLTAFITPEMMIERYLASRMPLETSLSFVSDRRKITLDPAEITYIESNDDVVRIHTTKGDSYRTKTRISQWEAQLDKRFLRVHRSYIINIGLISECQASRVIIENQTIEISRKYKDEVRRRLADFDEAQ